MSSILNRVQLFLSEANKASVPISSTIVNEFGEMCKAAFVKQFIEPRDKEFRPRMSNIGRPLCQLQMEKSGAKSEITPYNHKMRNFYGDIIEAMAVAILKSSGITVDAFQKKVKHKFKDTEISGTYDVQIMDKVWDIKSASPYSFKYKFGDEGGFDAIVKDDTFGYVSQGYLYGEADKKEFGGWIVIDKSSGEWAVVETPLSDEKYSKDALKKAEENLKILNSDAPFKRLYKDEEEFFNKKPTGNRILKSPCTFCPYKQACWGEVKYLPQQQSKAINPKYYWYTKVNNPKEEHDNSSQ